MKKSTEAAGGYRGPGRGAKREEQPLEQVRGLED